MAKGKSSVGFWLLIGTLVVGGGVGIYFLLREPKDETTDDNLDEKKDDTNIPIIKDDSGSGGGSQGKPKSSAPSELNTADKIKAFQNSTKLLMKWRFKIVYTPLNPSHPSQPHVQQYIPTSVSGNYRTDTIFQK
jgi:hypothetical protein